MFCYLPRFCPSPRFSSYHFLSVAVRTKCTVLIAVNNPPGIFQNVKLAHLACSWWIARPSHGFRHSRSVTLVSVECRWLIHTNGIHYLIASLAYIGLPLKNSKSVLAFVVSPQPLRIRLVNCSVGFCSQVSSRWPAHTHTHTHSSTLCCTVQLQPPFMWGTLSSIDGSIGILTQLQDGRSGVWPSEGARDPDRVCGLPSLLFTA